jgi:SAM-dependent methyltransferase
VDLDEEALRRRSQGKRDLTREIVGDLRTVELPLASFDVIYSSFVLEHVSGADRVLENFVRWLRPGGLLIIRVPDIRSVQAFLASCLPYRCSVLYHRYAWGSKDAGKPGFAPYPTVYDDVISQPGLREFCGKYGLLIQDEIGVGSYATRGSGIIRIATPILARLVRWLTLGRVHDHHVDLTLVVKKPAVGFQPARS